MEKGSRKEEKGRKKRGKKDRDKVLSVPFGLEVTKLD